MRTIKTYTKIEIVEKLGITEAQFRHAKEALKFTHVGKDPRGIHLYPESVCDQIKDYRAAQGAPCKGATPDLFDAKKADPSLREIMTMLEKLSAKVDLIMAKRAIA